MNRNRIKRICASFIILILLLSLMTGCISHAEAYHDKSFFAMDTIITIRVFGDRSAKKAMNKAIDRIKEIEKHMSSTYKDSDVFKINKAAGVEPVKVNDDTFYVIKKALEYGQLSDGALDITVRPIVELWGITSDNPRVPSKEEIDEKLALVDYRKVVLDEENKTVFLEEKGMGIDLGAIAKGYAADEAVRILREAGVKNALLNLGGNVITIGGNPDGRPWRIGIQDPRSQETGEPHFAIVGIADATVVSSGDYERYIEEVYEKTGERYHHIFDPKTGYPADKGLIASTIISSSSIDADALSTILFIMGYEEGFKLIEKLDNVEAIAVTANKEVYITEGLKGSLIQSNDNYRIMD